MSETSEAPIQSHGIRNKLSSLFRRNKPSPTPEVTSTLEPIQEDLKLEDIQVITTPEPQPLPERLKLRPVNKIFFHTTPSQNLDSIRQTGLFGEKGYEIVGPDLLYSLTYGEEFNSLPGHRPLARNGGTQDFSLTIWKNSTDIKRTNASSQIKDFGAAGPVEEPAAIPQGFLDSGGGYLSSSFDKSEYTKQILRKINPVNLLATVNLTDENKKFLVRCRLEFIYNLQTAAQIEQQMVDYFDQPESGIWLSEGYSRADFAHDMLGNMQQEVTLRSVSQIANNAEERLRTINLEDSNSRHNASFVLTQLNAIQEKQGRVNEPICARLIDMWMNHLNRIIVERKLEGIYGFKENNPYKPIITNPGVMGKYSQELLSEVGQEMGLTGFSR